MVQLACAARVKPAETDRRLLQKRVEQLQKRLEKVEVQRTQMRRARVRSELPRVALVGYTNAGKSTCSTP